MPSRRGWVLVLFLVPALGGGPARAEEEILIERIPAVVDGRPLMLTEVRFLGRLRGLEDAAAIEALIDERLMFREASRLPQAAVSGDEEEKAYQDLAARVLPELRAAAEGDLRRLARRQTAILKYIDFRLRPQVRITDEEVRAAYETQRATQPDRTYEEVAPALRRTLEARQLDERIEAWVKDLRQTSDIRYNR